MDTTKTLVKRKTIESLVNDYEDRCAQSVTLLTEFQKLMKNSPRYFLPRGWNIYSIDQHDINEVLVNLKKSYWDTIIKMSQIKDRMSTSNLEKLDRQLNDNSLPEFNTFNVLNFINNLAEDAPELMKSAILEAYRYLMPGRGNWNKHKTNKVNARNELGKKVILSGYISSDKWSCRVSYYYDKYLNVIGKVFALLDGKGVPEYKDTLTSLINEAIREDKSELQTEYFNLKWYSNTIHMSFRRMDLVKQINQIAADHHSLKDG